jgi:hypothetical protein
MSADQLSVGLMSTGSVYVGQMSVGLRSIDQFYFGQMSDGTVSVGLISVGLPFEWGLESLSLLCSLLSLRVSYSQHFIFFITYKRAQ